MIPENIRKDISKISDSEISDSIKISVDIDIRQKGIEKTINFYIDAYNLLIPTRYYSVKCLKYLSTKL